MYHEKANDAVRLFALKDGGKNVDVGAAAYAERARVVPATAQSEKAKTDSAENSASKRCRVSPILEVKSTLPAVLEASWGTESV